LAPETRVMQTVKLVANLTDWLVTGNWPLNTTDEWW